MCNGDIETGEPVSTVYAAWDGSYPPIPKRYRVRIAPWETWDGMILQPDPDMLTLLDCIMTDVMQQHDINDPTNPPSPPIVPPVETVGEPVRVLPWRRERSIDDVIVTEMSGRMTWRDRVTPRWDGSSIGRTTLTAQTVGGWSLARRDMEGGGAKMIIP